MSKKKVVDYIRGHYSSDDKGQCPPEEAAKKLVEALYKSKGRCNNQFAVELAYRKGATVDDVLRLGDAGEKVDYCRQVISTSNNKSTAWSKQFEHNQKRIGRLKDSIYAKYLKAHGLWEKAVEWDMAESPIRELFMNGKGYHYSKTRCLAMLMCFARAKTDRVQKYAPGVLNQWRDHINVAMPTDEAHRHFTDMKRRMLEFELECINELPKEEISRMDDGRDGRRPVPFARGYWATPQCYTDYHVELGRTMLESLDYMGIGIYCRWPDEYGRCYGDRSIHKGTVALAQQVLKVVKTFNKMIAEGYEPKLVREEVIGILNGAVEKKTSVPWKFFERVNAPNAYENLAKKKKTVTKKASKSAEPRYAEVDGVKIRIQ